MAKYYAKVYIDNVHQRTAGGGSHQYADELIRYYDKHAVDICRRFMYDAVTQLIKNGIISKVVLDYSVLEKVHSSKPHIIMIFYCKQSKHTLHKNIDHIVLYNIYGTKVTKSIINTNNNYNLHGVKILGEEISDEREI